MHYKLYNFGYFDNYPKVGLCIYGWIWSKLLRQSWYTVTQIHPKIIIHQNAIFACLSLVRTIITVQAVLGATELGHCSIDIPDMKWVKTTRKLELIIEAIPIWHYSQTEL